MAVQQEGNSTCAASQDAEVMRGLLGTQLKFVLSDGRVVVGTFQCMDKHRNFILEDGLETRQRTVTGPDGSPRTHDCERHLGLVMIPGKHLVSVSALAPSVEAARRGNGSCSGATATSTGVATG